MSAAPSPTYDLRAAIDTLFPGLDVQRELMDAAFARYAALGSVPLGPSDVAPILAAVNGTDPVSIALPPLNIDSPLTSRNAYPASLPPWLDPPGLVRIEDSNPDPYDGWVEFGAAQSQVNPV